MTIKYRLPLSSACMLSLILLSGACNNANPTHETENMTIKQDSISRPLEEELNAKKKNFEEKADSLKKKQYADGIQDVVNKQIVEHAMQVGDTALDFTLSNAMGKEISLYKALENGPVILMWYRGGWCPYCNLTLHYMQEYLPQFKKAGASLMALTPELPDKSMSTKEKQALTFDVLSDVNNVIAKKYGIVFTLTEDVAKAYQKSFDLHSYNGNTSNELPLAATYIIGKDRIIKYAYLNADYRNRAEPEDVLNALK